MDLGGSILGSSGKQPPPVPGVCLAWPHLALRNLCINSTHAPMRQGVSRSGQAGHWCWWHWLLRRPALCLVPCPGHCSRVLLRKQGCCVCVECVLCMSQRVGISLGELCFTKSWPCLHLASKAPMHTAVSLPQMMAWFSFTHTGCPEPARPPIELASSHVRRGSLFRWSLLWMGLLYLLSQRPLLSYVCHESGTHAHRLRHTCVPLLMHAHTLAPTHAQTHMQAHTPTLHT